MTQTHNRIKASTRIRDSIPIKALVKIKDFVPTKALIETRDSIKTKDWIQTIHLQSQINQDGNDK